MTYLLSGGAKNGKSTLAQNIALSLGGKRYYVATMIPTGPEDEDRIRRHIADRDGLGFETVECTQNILTCLEQADPNAVFLVDSTTALLQNALFPAQTGYVPDLDAAQRCADALVDFASLAAHVIFVSDYIESDAGAYSESTETYRRCLAAIDRRLAAVCDTVVEVAAGNYIVYKGALPL